MRTNSIKKKKKKASVCLGTLWITPGAMDAHEDRWVQIYEWWLQLGSTYSSGLSGVSWLPEYIKHVFPLVYFHFFFFLNGTGIFQNNSARIQQAYAVDCFTRGWSPHSLDFNPTETLWERSLSCRQFRMLARIQWNSRQKYMFWHCISVFKYCRFSQQKGTWRGWGSTAAWKGTRSSISSDSWKWCWLQRLHVWVLWRLLTHCTDKAFLSRLWLPVSLSLNGFKL